MGSGSSVRRRQSADHVAGRGSCKSSSSNVSMVEPLASGETELDPIPPLKGGWTEESISTRASTGSGEIAKTMTSGGQYGDTNQTLIFLDWDDTIFPTTALFAEWRVRPAEDFDVELPGLLEERMAAWRESLGGFLGNLRSMSERCVIVTNSKRPWVEKCVRRFAPQLLYIFQGNFGVEVVYASEVTMKKVRARGGLRPLARDATSDLQMSDYLMKQKQEAMRKSAQEFYSRYPGQTWKNVLSIGDMPYEHSAVQEMTFRRRSPAREKLRTKAITVPSSPSINQVTFRLEFFARLMLACVKYDGDMSVELEVRQNHLKVLAAALELPNVGSIVFPDSAWGDDPPPGCEKVALLLEELESKVFKHCAKPAMGARRG